MAACESCGKGGFEVEQLRVDEVRKVLIGPCCITVIPLNQVPDEKVHYGVEASDEIGVKAYVEFSGLKLEFRKTPGELKRMVEGT